MDYALTDRVFRRIDCRYNDFGSGEPDFGPALVGAKLDQRVVKARIDIKF